MGTVKGCYRIILAEKHYEQLKDHPGIRSDGTRMHSDLLVDVIDEPARQAVEQLLPGRVAWERRWFGPRPRPTEAQIQEARAKLPDPASELITDHFAVYLPGPPGSPPSESVRVAFVRRADKSGWDFFDREDFLKRGSH
jgi:hypothetical protein